MQTPSGRAFNQEAAQLLDTIRIIPDFPKPGIMFKDITPLLANPKTFQKVTQLFCEAIESAQKASAIEFDKIVAIDSRGFIFGAALAQKLGKGMVLVRKAGKLPGETIKQSYKLEYGEAVVEMQVGTLKAQEKVIVIDDVLATGGTAEAAIKLVQRQGAIPVLALFLMELEFLKGKAVLNIPHQALLTEV